MNLRKAAQQALEAMESVEWYGAGSGWIVDADAIEKSITALRAALAEPACCCGEPTAAGVVHRQDGPCYMAEPKDWELQRLRQEVERCKAACAATAEAWRMDALTVPSDCPDSHQPGCDHCNSPLWCGTKCKSCGRKA